MKYWPGNIDHDLHGPSRTITYEIKVCRLHFQIFCSNMRKNDYAAPRLAEIDGFRAIALIAVLLYHARLGSFFQGGFVGVDVFFVISGYVVTLSLLRQIRKDKFKFKIFLTRRVHRLLPALLVTIVCSNEIVRRIFTRSHQQEAAKLSISAIFSLSNIVLWLQSNYFDTDSRLKPYLHTWSLSVEWQFYLSWALISRFIYKRSQNKHKQLQILCAGFFASLATTTVLVSKNPSAAFYNILFRYNEFMVGSIPAWYSFTSSKPLSISENSEIEPVKKSIIPFIELYTWSAFSVMFVYFLFFKDTYSFPGITAIPLCLSSAVIIVFSGRSYLGMLLRHNTMQWLGDISYSVYLIHWPMLVFLDYVLLSKSTIIHRLMAIFLSILIGHMLNRLIERPFHKKEGFIYNSGTASKNIIILASVLATIFQANCLIMRLKHDQNSNDETWISKVFSKSMRLKFKRKHENRGHFGTLCHMTGKYPRPTNFETCNPRGNKEIVLFGDSHAQDFYAALNFSLSPNISVIQLTAAGFSFTEPFRDGPYKHCKIMYDAFPQLLEERNNSIFAAIMTSRWKPGVKLSDLQRLNATVDYFQKTLSVPVFVIGPRPEFNVAPLRILETHLKLNSSKNEIQELFDDGLRLKNEVDQLLEAVIKSRNSTYHKSMDAFCESNGTREGRKCRIFSKNEKYIYYTDRHHINSKGAMKIIEPIIREVQKLGNKMK